MNYQTQLNSNGTITVIPVVVYHNIDYKNNNSSDTTPKWIEHSTIDVNLFGIEMNTCMIRGFKVLTMPDLGYNQTS